MTPLLEVKNLTVRFARGRGQPLTAVDGVSFQLFPGEVLGIVGESGCGKSTVARAVTRLVDSSSGSIAVRGQDVTRVRGRRRRELYRHMQMVFQFPADSFDPRRTLGDGVGESLRNRGVSKKQAMAQARGLLEQCGLPASLAERYPHEVSGGQCQRAAIARALAIRPELLICDEATSALDVTVQQQILDLLDRCRREYAMAYLFICHDLALVERFCDRVLVMQAGRIVEQGTPEQVIGAPKQAYTRQLIESSLLFANY